MEKFYVKNDFDRVWIARKWKSNDREREGEKEFHSIPSPTLSKQILASKHNMNLYVASESPLCTSTSYRLRSKFFFSAMKYFWFWECCTFLRNNDDNDDDGEEAAKKREKNFTHLCWTKLQRKAEIRRMISSRNQVYEKTTKRKPKCFTTTATKHLSMYQRFFHFKSNRTRIVMEFTIRTHRWERLLLW